MRSFARHMLMIRVHTRGAGTSTLVSKCTGVFTKCDSIATKAPDRLNGTGSEISEAQIPGPSNDACDALSGVISQAVGYRRCTHTHDRRAVTINRDLCRSHLGSRSVLFSDLDAEQSLQTFEPIPAHLE